MAEQDPFKDFNIEDTMGSIYSFLKGDNKPKDAPELLPQQASSSELPDDEKLEQRHFEEQVLMVHAAPLVPLNPRSAAQSFRVGLQEARAQALRLQGESPNKIRWGRTTLESLAETAELKFQSMLEECGRAVPFTPRHSDLQRQATQWERIRDIAKGASEIK